MSQSSRREFMQQAGAGAAGLAALQFDKFALAAKSNAVPPIPPHRELVAPGVHAYPLWPSVPAGGTLELCASASEPFQLSIFRLGSNLDDPEGDELCVKWDEAPAQPQPIHPGSYVFVERKFAFPRRAFSFECWIRLWQVATRQAIFSLSDGRGSPTIALTVDAESRIQFSLAVADDGSDKTSFATKPGSLNAHQWQHLVVTWDDSDAKIYVDSELVLEGQITSDNRRSGGKLRIGAMEVDGRSDRFLDADIAMPVVYSTPISAAEIAERFRARGLKPAIGSHVEACWQLNEERGEFVADVSGNGHHGRIVNQATWMIGGPSFAADVPRFGDYDPPRDASRGHGLRLASDDLYDCRWKVTHRWQVPRQAKPGFYVARFEFSHQGTPRTYHCSFIVRRAADQPPARVALIAATTTWRAYNGTPFALTPAQLKQVWDTGGLTAEDHGLPAFCLYRRHAAGQGTYQVGLRMPWPAAGPYVLYSEKTDYSHLMRADRFIQAWLEEQSYDYDVITCEDLHRDPELLRKYQVALIAGHNEYWSWPMYRGVEVFLADGGNLLVLSGNTMGWRVSFNDDCTIMECRKADGGGSQVDEGRRGEAWHSQDGLHGGHQRECGMPGYRLVGVDIIGWNHPSNPRNLGPYVVEDESHFLFTTPEATGLENGDRFGWGGEGQLPMANIHEMDIRPSTFAALQQEPTPIGAVMPDDPPGIVRIANGVVPWKEGGSATDYFGRSITPAIDQGGEMIYWERPDGGRVFNASAIGSGWVLHADPRWAALVRNVLHHFGVPRGVS